jgi:hypothetical protein
MRKFAGALVALTVALPIGLIASPAMAASGTTCKTASGTAKFSPALPILSSKAKVFDVLTATGPVSGCTGGGVTSGTTKVNAPKDKNGANCTTLTTSKTPTTATEIITWNTKATSTVAIKLSPVAGKPPTTRSLTGTVTAGLFKGMHQSGQVSYTLPAGACMTKALTSVTYKGITPLVIK